MPVTIDPSTQAEFDVTNDTHNTEAQREGETPLSQSERARERLRAVGAPPILYNPTAPIPPLHLPITEGGFATYTEPQDGDDDEITQYRAALREWDRKRREEDLARYEEKSPTHIGETVRENNSGPPRGSWAHWVDLLPSQRRTDAGNALFFASVAQDHVRYARDVREWLVWDQERWNRGGEDIVLGFALAVTRRLPSLLPPPSRHMDSDAARNDEAAWLRWAAKSLAVERIAAIPKLAKADPMLACSLDEFDADPMLLNCPNGTVDLRTGDLRPHDPADLITKVTTVAYDPTATAPRFTRFLSEVTQGSVDLQRWLKVLFGYCITGSVAEEILPIFYGSGGNGKTKLVEAIFAVLGDYAVKANSDLLVKTKGDKHVDMVMHLIGSRLAIATEAAAGARLDERIVKELTGGDTVNARRLYQGSKDYRPTWKLLWRTNDLPEVDHFDDAIRRRVRVVPFLASFKGREDRNIDAELATESAGILAWLIDGARQWHEALTAPGATTGLPYCAEIDATTHEYEADNDPLAVWLHTRTIEGKTERGELWNAYQQWSFTDEASDVAPVRTRNAFYKALREKGVAECFIGTRRAFAIAVRTASSESSGLNFADLQTFAAS